MLAEANNEKVINEVRTNILRTGDIWVHNNGYKKMDGLVFYDDLCTLTSFADMEDAVAMNTVKLLKSSTQQVTDHEIEYLIHEYELETGATLHIHQKDGVKMIVRYALSVLTGGPGTGKTTTINCAAYVLRKIKPFRILFTAPTGKAARRITESTGEDASTLHHLLGIGYNQQRSTEYNEDIVFIDESSMNDLSLTDCLMQASTAGKKLVWIGDIDQIPSVGPGAVLRDYILSGIVPVTNLTKTFRQNEGELLHNIKEITKGSSSFDVGETFSETILPDTIYENALNNILLTKYIEEVKVYGPENVAVLLPYRKSGYCSDLVNRLIQKKINPSGLTWKYKEWMFRKNDPVMQLNNREECVNGEVGIVTRVEKEGITVKYGKNSVFYTPETMNELALAYAMSVTKSQGSEYKSVILCQLNSHEYALNRNILYTGMSRAKNKCTLLTQKKALRVSVDVTATGRKTLLTEKIRCVA